MILFVASTVAWYQVLSAFACAFAAGRQRYITTSREVKRWDATSRSPVYASFSATLKVSLWEPCHSAPLGIVPPLLLCVCCFRLWFASGSKRLCLEWVRNCYAGCNGLQMLYVNHTVFLVLSVVVYRLLLRWSQLSAVHCAWWAVHE